MSGGRENVRRFFQGTRPDVRWPRSRWWQRDGQALGFQGICSRQVFATKQSPGVRGVGFEVGSQGRIS